MRRLSCTAFAAATLLVSVTAVQAQDVSRAVAGGGISVQGWQGKIDAAEEGRGMNINQAKFAREGDALHALTGPAVVYWNPANTASGNYTVKATFREPQYMAHMDHPHPYGIVIAGNDLGTPQQSMLYCAAYGNGTFIVRGFGPDPFSASARRPEANPAINRAAGRGEPVTQEIAVTVKDDSIECAINGTVVGTYPKAELVATGRLKSTDGVYGLRFAHNTEAFVTGLTVTRQ